MDRKTYLKKFAGELKKTCSENQVKDILSDYSDFFDAGIADGKNEDKLCNEFGPPRRAARELLEQSGKSANWRGIRLADTTCIAFIVLSTMAFAALSRTVIQNGGPVKFLPAMLFPLLLQVVFFIRKAIGIPTPTGYRSVPRVQIIFSAPPAVAAVLICYGIVHIVPIAKEIPQSSNFFNQFLFLFLPWGAAGSLLIIIISEILFFLFAVHGHWEARWFLFLDTTVYTLFLNLLGTLCSVDIDTFNGTSAIASSILCAVVPNLAAAALFLALLKIPTLRRKIHGRPNEKGHSGNVRPV